MKTGIHPQYFDDAQTTCSSCGKVYKFGSTKQSIVVEICANCHPTFTGEQRFMNTGGVIDRFQKKMEQAKVYKKKLAEKKKKEEAKKARPTKSLKELMAEL
ncbi:50S ribosomal protein L31 [Candidatus Woesebacteria bacterium]|nr:50S ribosomal protein L31 [Candidatus Woesebacteria bacterium]